MTLALGTPSSMARNRTDIQIDLLVAAACTGLLAAVFAIRAMAGLQPPVTDNDSLLRLVTIRDLLAGQSWFDPVQYRMGPVGGFEMHWSRLVDAPVAALIVSGNALGFDGEQFAGFLWPLLLSGVAFFAILRSARILGGRSATLPAAVIGLATLYSIAAFAPGFFDHHNVQVALGLLLLLFFIDHRRPQWRGIGAGVLAALMMAIGMETAPFVAVACAVAAAILVFEEAGGASFATGFGGGFAAMTAAAFALTIAPDRWSTVQCDALSLVHPVMAAMGGGGLLVAGVLARHASRSRRLLFVGAIGLICAATAVLAFPQCLRAPYADLDPLLHTFWLDHVIEARPALSYWSTQPGLVTGLLMTPLIALFAVGYAIARGSWTHRHLVIAGLVGAAFLITLWQIRGGLFAVAFSVIPLAAMIGRLRERASKPGASQWAILAMAGAWLFSAPTVWSSLGSQFQADAQPVEQGETQASAQGGASDMLSRIDLKCQTATSLQALGALSAPAGQQHLGVLAISNLGSPILAHTTHRVAAGPYHRNDVGNLAAIRAFTGSPAEARAIMTDLDLSVVALCPANDETAFFVERAPDGFLAQLNSGRIADWLEPVPGPAAATLKLFRVK